MNFENRDYRGWILAAGFQRPLCAGAVATSSCVSHCKACSRLSPHISPDGCKPPQNAGRSGLPNKAQRRSLVSCTQGTPAGLPCGMPGKGVLIEGAMQQAAHAERQLRTDMGAMLSVETACCCGLLWHRSLFLSRHEGPETPLRKCQKIK